MDQDAYSRLKKEILKCTGTNVDLTPVKQHFRPVISKRSLHRISCVAHLIQHLEDLDCVSAENVKYLEDIAGLLNSRGVYDLIKTYKKLCGISGPPVSEPCPSDSHRLGTEHIIFPSGVQLIPQSFEDHILPDLLENRPNDLVCAIVTLSSKLKMLWPVVMRELGLKEGYIRSLRKKFKGDYQRQAQVALDYWSITDNAASVEKLHDVLSGSECQRRGLSPNLTKFEPYVRMLI